MAKTSRQFYKELGAEKLAARKEDVHTRKELNYLKKLLTKNQRILDLACGFGRFTIPLAKQGYNTQGIDISPNLIREARVRAKEEKLNIKFKVGDMRKLSYKASSFDVIICMWSAFIELSRKSDQLRAIKEMHRVLDKDGFALLEMPVPGTERSLKIEGIIAPPMSTHDEKTLRELMKAGKIIKYKVFRDSFGGRTRLFLQFWK